MQRTFQTRIAAVLLALFTGAAMVCAGFNLVQENRYQSPTDGVWWIEAQGGLKAERVPADSPGERAGVKPGDLLVAANDQPTPVGADLAREIWRTRAYNTIHYTLVRDGIACPMFLSSSTCRTAASTRVSASSLWSISASASMCCCDAGPPPIPPTSISFASFFRPLLLLDHRQVQRVRLDRRVEQDRRKRTPARALPALRTGIFL